MYQRASCSLMVLMSVDNQTGLGLLYQKPEQSAKAQVNNSQHDTHRKGDDYDQSGEPGGLLPSGPYHLPQLCNSLSEELYSWCLPGRRGASLPRGSPSGCPSHCGLPNLSMGPVLTTARTVLGKLQALGVAALIFHSRVVSLPAIATCQGDNGSYLSLASGHLPLVLHLGDYACSHGTTALSYGKTQPLLQGHGIP